MFSQVSRPQLSIGQSKNPAEGSENSVVGLIIEYKKYIEIKLIEKFCRVENRHRSIDKKDKVCITHYSQIPKYKVLNNNGTKFKVTLV